MFAFDDIYVKLITYMLVSETASAAGVNPADKGRSCLDE
jgi:hypothetical protein